MQLKPLAEILKLTKEKIDEALAPTRARLVRAQGDVEIAKLEERLAAIEKDVQVACTSKDINFQKIVDLLDEHELTQRKIKQLNTIVDQMFPTS